MTFLFFFVRLINTLTYLLTYLRLLCILGWNTEKHKSQDQQLEPASYSDQTGSVCVCVLWSPVCVFNNITRCLWATATRCVGKTWWVYHWNKKNSLTDLHNTWQYFDAVDKMTNNVAFWQNISRKQTDCRPYLPTNHNPECIKYKRYIRQQLGVRFVQ